MRMRNTKTLLLTVLLCFIAFAKHNNATAGVRLVESSTVTNDAFYFWKANDSKPYHYGSTINPHGNCLKTVNGYVFYTWYRGGWDDRTLMVSRKKIGSGDWVHVEFTGKKLSLVGGKGDTHLTTNIGVCPIDGTVHIMYDHHNEDLNYIISKKGIAFAPDSDFTLANFNAQRDYLQVGKKMTGVTYPDMFTNDAGELLCVRRKGSAVGGDVLTSYYDGDKWSVETTMFQGTGSNVTQGDRNFTYGSGKNMGGSVYYSYSIRWAESPTRLNEGVYFANCGPRMNEPAKDYKGRAYPLPIINHDPFFIADPRSIPDNAGWAGGATAAVSDKGDVVLTIVPKGGVRYTYLKPANSDEFTQKSGVSNNGTFYGNRLYRFYESGGKLIVQSCLAGTLNWRVDFEKNIGFDLNKSKLEFSEGKLVAVFAEQKSSATIPIHCFVVEIDKPEYTPQTISFDPLNEVLEGAEDITLNATASSNLPVSYTSSNRDVAEIIDGNKVKVRGPGFCDITASQLGNGEFDVAPEVVQTLTVNSNAAKTNQTINFTLVNKNFVWGTPDEVLNATATSGLPITYEVVDQEVAEIIDGKLHVKRAGSTIIRAMQEGNDTYNAAPIVSHVLTVPIRQQVITFEAIPEVNSADPEFRLVATSNNPNAKLKFSCPNNQVAVVWSDIVRHVLGTGTAKITVSDVGDEYFTPASVSKNLVVKSKVHTIPTQIEAEHYTSKSGVNVTRWSNSVFYLNSWEANDFAEYTVEAPEDGTYVIEIHAASPAAGKKLKIMSGTNTLATVTLTTTPNLTNFKNTTASIDLKKGVQSIKVVGVVGGFNYDWMNITGGTIEKEEAKDYTVVAVDGEQAPNVATNLYDGNISDDARWSVNGFPSSVVLDLGEEKEIIGTKVWTYQSRAYQYKVEVSNTPNSGFVQVVDRTANITTAQPIVNNFAAQKGRYAKLTVTGCHNYASTWVSINEFAVMVKDQSTSANKIDAGAVKAYVANHQLYIETPSAKNNEVFVYSLTGKVLFREAFETSKYTRPFNEKQGAYIISVRSNNALVSKKVFVD